MIGPPQLTSTSTSFTSKSSNNLTDIAARVVEEFHNQNGDNEEIYNFDVCDDEPDGISTEILKETEEESDEDGEFEFAVICRRPNSSSASADEIFFNGEILPRYPLFDRSLLLEDVADKSDRKFIPDRISPTVRQPLKKLFDEERESASCSSSEADDLDGVAPGTYCIWKPKVESPERCKKSNSTGNTSKRWKLRNLLHRSQSDTHMAAGKNASVIIFNPVVARKKRGEKVKKVEKTSKVAGADDDEPALPVTDETNFANETSKEGNRVRSYLPYKQDLVGAFANVNGLSRNLHPF